MPRRKYDHIYEFHFIDRQTFKKEIVAVAANTQPDAEHQLKECYPDADIKHIYIDI